MNTNSLHHHHIHMRKIQRYTPVNNLPEQQKIQFLGYAQMIL